MNRHLGEADTRPVQTEEELEVCRVAAAADGIEIDASTPRRPRGGSVGRVVVDDPYLQLHIDILPEDLVHELRERRPLAVNGDDDRGPPARGHAHDWVVTRACMSVKGYIVVIA